MNNATNHPIKEQSLINPVLIVGCIIVMIGFSIRASFGVFQLPIANEFGWMRADFSMAIAIQNLAWGIGQPIFAAIAERFGDRRAIILGGLFYAVGLVLSSYAVTPGAHQFLEILVGFGVAGTGFGVILASLGIATAAGSAGQVIGPPFAEYLLGMMNWSSVFLIFAAIILGALFFLPFMRVPVAQNSAKVEESMFAIVNKAIRDPSYILIFIGFFSCGYQLSFVTAHFPAFIAEVCGPIAPGSMIAGFGITTTSSLGAWAIAVIGLFNIFGTILAGYLGNFFPKKHLLALVYLGRTLIAAWFILTPMTPESVMIFSALMGFLWLATVPLTSFLGVWLGGMLHDAYGSYTQVWWVGVGVGALSVVVHLPIKERPYEAREAAA